MSMTVNEIELIEGLAQEKRMPKHIIGMDAHSRKVSLSISEARYGRDPLVLRELSDIQLDRLSTYGQRILKILFLQVGQALVRRTTAHSISRWAGRKVASGKPYLVMCVAAGRKALVYAWHNMMGHPAPDRESERMFRTKVMAIYKEFGEDAAGITGFRKSPECAKAVLTSLYAHLSA